jgi:hypothetical protein
VTPKTAQIRIIETREDFGLRWQSAAATPLFDREQSFQSGVALRFPPQSKPLRLGVFALKVFCMDTAKQARTPDKFNP